MLYVVLDDVGFSAMEPFGGLIETPNINRIAERGLRYTIPHDRAVLADALVPADRSQPHDQQHGQHHRGGSGFPNSNGHIPFEYGTLAEVLGERGWNTYSGKWHSRPRTR